MPKKENKNNKCTASHWNCSHCFCSWQDKDHIISFSEYAEHVNHCNGLPALVMPITWRVLLFHTMVSFLLSFCGNVSFLSTFSCCGSDQVNWEQVYPVLDPFDWKLNHVKKY